VTTAPTSRAAGRDEILAAATDMFGEAGYDAVSMSTIAERAGTSKANLFHHFGSKDCLYLEVMRAACKVFAQSIDAAARVEEGFDERLRTLIQQDLALMRANPDRSHLILREVLESGECRGRALAGKVFEDQFGEIVELFRLGREAGALCDDVPAELAATMMIACNVFLFQSQNVLRYLPGVDFVDDPERYAALVSRVLLRGVERPGGAETVTKENEI